MEPAYRGGGGVAIYNLSGGAISGNYSYGGHGSGGYGQEDLRMPKRGRIGKRGQTNNFRGKVLQ